MAIPGYQPVERLKESPSFGVWIRAVQTRLDRRVLLKVLPPTKGPLPEYFGREISGMVRLEGHGVLRLIDEGTAGGIRYMVLDEAGASAITAEDRLTANEWTDLRTRLHAIFSYALAQECVLLPMPPSAFRRLPTGDVFVLELGWLVPVGKKLPAHEGVPDALRGQPAEPAHNALFCATTLETFARFIDRRRPRWVMETVAALRRPPADADQPLAALEPSTAPTPAGRPKFLVPGLIALGALLIAAGVWFQQSRSPSDAGKNGKTASTGPTDEDPSVTEPRNGTSDPSGETEAAAAAEVERQRLLSERAAEAFGEAIGSYETISARVTDETPFTEAEVRFLTSAVVEFGETEWGEVAAALLRLHSLTHRVARAEVWRNQRGEIRTLFEADEIGRAEQGLARVEDELAELRSIAGVADDLWGSWWALTGRTKRAAAEDSLSTLVKQLQHRIGELELSLAFELRKGPATVAEAIAHWKSEFERVGTETRKAIEEAVEEQRDQRVYGPALEMIAKNRRKLLVRDHDWVDTLAREVREEGESYALAKRTGSAVLERAFELCRGGKWSEALAAMAEANPGDRFPVLRDRNERWTARIREAQFAAGALRSALEKRLGADAFGYEIHGDDERFRGSLVEFVPGDKFTLKREGRQGPRALRTLSYADLTVAELERIDAESGEGDVAEEQWLMMLFFLGAGDRAIARAKELPTVPTWVADAQAIVDARLAEALEASLDEGDAALTAGNFGQVRKIVDGLLGRYSKEELAPHRATHLERWLDGIYQEKGPVAAFPGATEASWDAGKQQLSLLYEFDEEKTVADWNQVQREPLTDHVSGEPASGSRIRNLTVRGSAFLAPRGELEIFSGHLSVEVRCGAENPRAPNLNVILWSRQPFDRHEGLLAGFGFKPAQVNNLTGDDDFVNLVLPANVFGPLRNVARRGRAHELFAVDQVSKVPRGRCVVAVFDDGEESSAALRSSHSFRKSTSGGQVYVGDTYGEPQDRVGTVEIRTYGNTVQVFDVWVEGRVSPAWWDEWRRSRVAEELDR